MTRWRSFFASIAVAALPASLAAAPAPAPQRMTAAEQEPFHSFRLIDAKLTLLSKQLGALKTAVSGSDDVSSGGRNFASGSVTAILTQMSSTTIGIEGITGRLQRLYQNRHEPFGVRMFGILRSRAQAVQRAIRSLRRARMQSDAARAEKSLDEHMVSFIVQFQAASGGYGATHCPSKTRICCQPKRSRDLQSGEQAACKWLCVSSTPACRGFLGPRIR
jgi:hypothetical protein